MPMSEVLKEGRPRIAITYCTQCNWLLRSAWMSQELLHTFGADIAEVALRPGLGGVFQIHYDDVLIWDRVAEDGFPDVKALKQRVRDRLDPTRDLGHLDGAGRRAV
jgi:selenoprotein W-related protein